ncbi:hypothetical protein HZH66_002968 [Vespula vulgaris]|uniref:Uncharacterized protein n=1 Tax=Vespula vulgaris TaxID=7454 RepID=A0A834KMC7_VESVU|nr:hypothetical protein HZH66_002968 [Vespula vulgaris]
MLPGESGSVSSVNVDHGKPTNSWARPQFDDIAPKNITAIVGQTAELNCYVKRPGDRVVGYVGRGVLATQGLPFNCQIRESRMHGKKRIPVRTGSCSRAGGGFNLAQAGFQPGFGQMNRSSILDEVTARDMENRSYTSTTPVSGNDQSPLRSVP